ncbi:MAG: [protein-PII] uridylyltransferase [Alcaligenaceae bacterium]|nr:[protein-PII] uridylyltransferase [Alcaligenaceae bacterium]
MASKVLSVKQQLNNQRDHFFSLYKQQKIRTDTLLASLRKTVDQTFKNLVESYPLPKDAALCAVGGYGRGELYPFSDIDILILLKKDPSPDEQAQLEAFITALWDLGLDIGHSVRTIEQCLHVSKTDITIETTLLELRFILGNHKLANELSGLFKSALNPREFFLAKRLEWQQRHARFNETPYSLEPNCKESPGALRDLQLIHWLAEAAGIGTHWHDLLSSGLITDDEVRKLKKAQLEFKRLRIELHLLAKKREDRLLFHTQPLLAEVYKIKAQGSKRPSEVLMQRYYNSARIVYQLTQFMMQNFQDYFFPVKNIEIRDIDEDFRSIQQRLDIKADDAFERKPQLLLKTFVIMQQHPELSDITVRTQRAIWSSRHRIDAQFRRNPVNQRLFLQFLQAPTGIVHNIRRMHMLNVLPMYIPAFRKVIGQMQHDLFHVYTVDQHTLMVIRNIRRFTMPEHAREYPLATRLIADLDKHWLLYIAALFHDIAKGRGGDHSELGAVEVRKFAKDHKLESEDAQLLEFLVANHLKMSTVAQKQDLSDPQVIQEFVNLVQTERRLTALYLLTVADIRGTSPKVWTSWKGKLLEDLYNVTLAALGGAQLDRSSILSQRKNDAMTLISLAGLDTNDRDRFWSKMDVAYFLRHEAQEIAWHTRQLYKEVDAREVIVKARPSDKNECIQILVYTKDKEDLFEMICSYFYENQINILDARIHTSKDGYALDSFVVDSPAFGDDSRSYVPIIEHGLSLKITGKKLEDSRAVLNRKKRFSMTAGVRRSRTFPIVPSVELQPDELSKSWRLHITATDTPGILYSLAAAFSRHNINLQMAKVMTLGERVEDVFILDGNVLENPRTQLLFERDLLETLTNLTYPDTRVTS